MPLRIVLADDHAPFRHCLAGLLNQQPGLSVVMAVDSGCALIAALDASSKPAWPDVVLLDMELRDMSGLTAATHLLSMRPSLRILMLSWHDDPPFMQAAFDAGVMGYMLKDDPLPELANAVRQVAGGRRVISPALQQALRHTAVQSQHSAD